MIIGLGLHITDAIIALLAECVVGVATSHMFLSALVERKHEKILINRCAKTRREIEKIYKIPFKANHVFSYFK